MPLNTGSTVQEFPKIPLAWPHQTWLIWMTLFFDVLLPTLSHSLALRKLILPKVNSKSIRTVQKVFECRPYRKHCKVYFFFPNQSKNETKRNKTLSQIVDLTRSRWLTRLSHAISFLKVSFVYSFLFFVFFDNKTKEQFRYLETKASR